MRVKFWGVRSGLAAPGRATLGVGGNTPCIEVRTATNALLVLDAGIGLHWLGRTLLAGPHGRGQGETTIFLSRTHWDHIQGIPFFIPAFLPGNRINIHGAGLSNRTKSMTLRAILEGQMSESYSPIVSLTNMPSIRNVSDVTPGKPIEVGGVTVLPRVVLRDGQDAESIAYRIEEEGRALVYVSDVEYAKGEPDPEIVAFAKDASLLVHEAYFTEDEQRKATEGRGADPLRSPHHATFGEATELALRAGAKRLFYSQHHPDHDDATIEKAVLAEREKVKKRGSSLEVETAREGIELVV
jgi:phosphoribosyl 1,2-cyclic phosphodiesterase